MQRFNQVFRKNQCNIIGMIHALSLPGTPKYDGNFNNCIELVRYEANIYKKHKVDAVLLENMHDVPYVQDRHIQSETVACMTRLSLEIKQILPKSIPCGIQILACGNQQALSVAKAADLQFIRVEGFVFAHIADEGFTNSNAGQLLRYRKQIDAESVLIFTDIKKKHSSHSITEDVSLLETIHAAEFFLTDGNILTGSSTGQAANVNDLEVVHKSTKSPILIGSGVTIKNVNSYYKKSNGLIIGSYFKRDGHWANEICEKRLGDFMEKINNIRN